MARIAGSDGTKMQVETGSAAARIAQYVPDIGLIAANCRLRVDTTKSGALTAIAAKTATAGHLVHLFNKHATKFVVIRRAKAKFQVTVLPATAQEFGFGFYRTTAASVQATGGLAQSLASPEGKLRKSHNGVDTAVDCYYANGTGALTAGTYTPNTAALEAETAWALVAGATIPINHLVVDYQPEPQNPLVLEPGEGILLANEVLMANSIAGVLRCAFEGFVCDSYPQ